MQCVFCGVVLGDWCPSERLATEHARASPSCMFAQERLELQIGAYMNLACSKECAGCTDKILESITRDLEVVIRCTH